MQTEGALPHEGSGDLIKGCETFVMLQIAVPHLLLLLCRLAQLFRLFEDAVEPFDATIQLLAPCTRQQHPP